MRKDPNLYYCSECGFEFKDFFHRNGSFMYYCPRCRKEMLFSNALREVVGDNNEKIHNNTKLLYN